MAKPDNPKKEYEWKEWTEAKNDGPVSDSVKCSGPYRVRLSNGDETNALYHHDGVAYRYFYTGKYIWWSSCKTHEPLEDVTHWAKIKQSEA